MPSASRLSRLSNPVFGFADGSAWGTGCKGLGTLGGLVFLARLGAGAESWVRRGSGAEVATTNGSELKAAGRAFFAAGLGELRAGLGELLTGLGELLTGFVALTTGDLARLEGGRKGSSTSCLLGAVAVNCTRRHEREHAAIVRLR